MALFNEQRSRARPRAADRPTRSSREVGRGALGRHARARLLRARRRPRRLGRPHPAHVTRSEVGEILSYGSGEYATPAGLVELWMESAEHRAHDPHARPPPRRLGVATGTFKGQDAVSLVTRRLLDRHLAPNRGSRALERPPRDLTGEVVDFDNQRGLAHNTRVRPRFAGLAPVLAHRAMASGHAVEHDAIRAISTASRCHASADTRPSAAPERCAWAAFRVARNMPGQPATQGSDPQRAARPPCCGPAPRAAARPRGSASPRARPASRSRRPASRSPRRRIQAARARPVGELQQAALGEALRPQRRDVDRRLGAEHLGRDDLADRGRELEAVPAPGEREVQAGDARRLADDRVPVGRVVVGAGPRALPGGAGERRVALAERAADRVLVARATPRGRSRRRHRAARRRSTPRRRRARRGRAARRRSRRRPSRRRSAAARRPAGAARRPGRA